MRVTKNDKFMQHQISVKVPIDVFESLREEALKHRISISDVVRERILAPQDQLLLSQAISDGSNKAKSSQKTFSDIDLAIIEILFLLREFLLERNGQILKKTDEKMEKRFGKDRKKFL